MNLQLLTCLLVALTPAVSSQGTYEDCCLKYIKYKKQAFLRYIKTYIIQEVNGSCNRPAIIFVLPRNKFICGNPNDKWVKDKMRDLDRQRKTIKNSWKPREKIKDCRGNNTNITRPLVQDVHAHRIHGIARNQTRLKHG
uniref:C-C motif chemokine ligand 25 n=1 Tax=Monodelphis domestica TaxID=13616 RepID=K7E087_MONDO